MQISSVTEPSYQDVNIGTTGTKFTIGDGYSITAGHIAFEYNRNHSSSPINIDLNDIVTNIGSISIDVARDTRSYEQLYLDVYRIEYSKAAALIRDDAHLEAVPSLRNNDFVVIRDSSNAGKIQQDWHYFMIQMIF